jgi:hypothetical protein
MMTGGAAARDSHRQRLALRRLRWVGCVVWGWSWYTMYLEIFRWGHVTSRLRFDSTPIPGTQIRPKPGRPLKALYVCFFGAPLVVIGSVIVDKTWRVRGRNFASK